MIELAPIESGAHATAGVPPRDCDLCPRLVELRTECRTQHPDWHNAPVPSFTAGPDSGGNGPRLLIVGLAPGMKGANRTGRPFTGDYAGDFLYQTLIDYGFAQGVYQARPDDGLRLFDAAITNAVRCLPPANKPIGAEIKACRRFLRSQVDALSALQAILALGKVAHDSVVAAFGHKLAAFKFGHGAQHAIGPGITLFDSYHCSRYNTNTRRLTEDMFRAVFNEIRGNLDYP
ncbi:MAG: uracil-DNA glycosylase [Sphingomonadales bacterium]